MRFFLTLCLLIGTSPLWAQVARIPAKFNAGLNPHINVYSSISRALYIGLLAQSQRNLAPSLVPSIKLYNQPKLDLLMSHAPIPTLPVSAITQESRIPFSPAELAPLKKSASGIKKGKVSKKHLGEALAVLSAVNETLDKIDLKDLEDPNKVNAVLSALWGEIEKKKGATRPKTRARKGPTLAEVIRKNGEHDDRDLADALEYLTQGQDAEPFIASLRAKSLGILGRGNEAIVVELAPTETLLKDKAFREGLAEIIETNPRLKDRFYKDVPRDVREDFPGREIESIMAHLPESFVAKLIRPDGGSWMSDWGYRSFDAPFYAKFELGEGYFLILQEKLDMSAEVHITILRPQLGKDWQIIDPGAAAQVGYDSKNRLLLADYAAIGRPGEDDAFRQLSDPAQYLREQEERSAAETFEAEAQNELLRHGLSDTNIDLQARRQEALRGEGKYRDLSGGHKGILNDLLQDAGDNPRVSSQAIEDAVMMTALQREEYPNTAPAKEAVNKVLAWAVKENLIRK